jgi:hypothetical protein
LVCIFVPFLRCSYPISISLALAASSTSSTLYILLQLYHQEGSRGGDVAARVEGCDRGAKQRDVLRLQCLAHHSHQGYLAMISRFRRQSHTPFREPLQFIVMSVIIVISGTFPHTYRVFCMTVN